ncbi:type VII secretion integral membrane protein EccD [Sanguibacter suaedae]|uniref:Type VII secretion integral membrane protein EccD n=1 Tax=Sanguibacter suaedae TaxID=2795737 RepID=A0A934IAT6_9MICO|nr:type VII secretion integral membrane protein EccD [Sanguibacter suaedae]MBI9114360.1 type VII secretion integral membrane protein EccD [Sanguibacter suaedae]
MVEAPSAPTALGTLVRISVVAGDRRLDVGAPGSIPLAELVPGLARSLRLLDPSTVYGGYRLLRADGQELDTSVSLIAQGITDGEVLTLEAGATTTDHRVYDDVVEAVADAVERDSAPWTPQDSARTAVGAAVAFLLSGAVLILGSSDGSSLPPVVALVAGALVVAAAAVVGRREQYLLGAQALVLCAAAFWAVGGLLLPTPGPAGIWGWPAAAAGAGALAAGLVAAGVLPARREVAVVPVTAGAVLGLAGVVVATGDAPAGHVLALTVALAVTASNGIPWLALASTPVRVVSPQSDAEIGETPPPVSAESVQRAYDRGRRVQLALRSAVGLVTLIVTPTVVGLGAVGTVLMVLCFTGMLLSVRQTYSRTDVGIAMTTGVVGITLATLAAALLHPSWHGTLLVSVSVVAAVVVGACLVAPRPRAAFGRVADSVELVSLALLLPLGVTAAGLL